MQAKVGTVHLRVAQLDRTLAFYQDVIGLREQRREDDTVFLGVDGDPILALIDAPDGQRAGRTTGLFHFAILVPSRLDLAKSLKRIAETRTPLQGMSDHIVSEAIYLADPEGNGIEIYRDRPREAWYKDGQFQLATLPMDVDGVLGTLNGADDAWTGLADGTVMGHMHLHVGDIREAEDFYVGLAGMDTMMNVGSATFLSYEGYHHHLGANVWGGRVPPPPNALGLDRWEMHLPDAATLETTLAQLDAAGVSIEETDAGYAVRDPSQNQVVLRMG